MLEGNVLYDDGVILVQERMNLCCGVFCEFSVGDFWVYLGGDSFSRRIGKIKGDKKY